MSDESCAGPLQRWGRGAPGPWAALFWLPFMLAEPVTQIGDNAPAWAGLVVVTVSFVLAVALATRPSHRERHRPDMLLAVQAVATAGTLIALPAGSGVWLWVLLALGIGAAAHRRWAPYVVVAVAVLAGIVTGITSGSGEAVGLGFTVLVSGVGTYSFYRLYDVIGELNRTRDELARSAVREERQRLSRDLHDLLGHSLSVIVVKAEAVRRLAPRDLDAAVSHAIDIETIGRQALTDVRQTVAGYRGDGLAAELERAEQALAAAGIALTVTIEEDLPQSVLDQPVLGWVVREAVTNVIRHSGARSCRIDVAAPPGLARVRVTDDGVGPATDSDAMSGGLSGLRDRVQAVGGRVELAGMPGEASGVRLTADVPRHDPSLVPDGDDLTALTAPEDAIRGPVR